MLPGCSRLLYKLWPPGASEPSGFSPRQEHPPRGGKPVRAHPQNLLSKSLNHTLATPVALGAVR